MKSAFLPELVNGPFGDPGLYVGLRWMGTALQFDLGSLDRFPAAKILKLTHIFVSHTHIDHFVGFDRVLRLLLARDVQIKVYGPPGIIDNVRGKLAGYTWNLVDGYPFVIEVFEVSAHELKCVRFRAATAFEIEDGGTGAFTGLLCEQATFAVRAVHLDHRISSLAFAVIEPRRLNVRPDELKRMGVAPGPWINELKDAIRTSQPPTTEITCTDSESGCAIRFSLGDLRQRLIVETPGEKLAYVVDARFTQANASRVVDLAADADTFFCESLFLDADRDQAAKRYHLTARQAGTLARMANVKRLRTFHFSPRYEGQAQRLIAEAEDTFDGRIDEDIPD